MSWKRGNDNGNESDEENFDEEELLGDGFNGNEDAFLDDDGAHSSLLDEDDGAEIAYNQRQFRTGIQNDVNVNGPPPDDDLAEGEEMLEDEHDEVDDANIDSGAKMETLDTQVDEEEYAEFSEISNDTESIQQQRPTGSKVADAYTNQYSSNINHTQQLNRKNMHGPGPREISQRTPHGFSNNQQHQPHRHFGQPAPNRAAWLRPSVPFTHFSQSPLQNYLFSSSPLQNLRNPFMTNLASQNLRNPGNPPPLRAGQFSQNPRNPPPLRASLLSQNPRTPSPLASSHVPVQVFQHVPASLRLPLPHSAGHNGPTPNVPRQLHPVSNINDFHHAARNVTSNITTQGPPRNHPPNLLDIRFNIPQRPLEQREHRPSKRADGKQLAGQQRYNYNKQITPQQRSPQQAARSVTDVHQQSQDRGTNRNNSQVDRTLPNNSVSDNFKTKEHHIAEVRSTNVSTSHVDVGTARANRFTEEASTSSHMDVNAARANRFTEGASKSSHVDVNAARAKRFTEVSTSPCVDVRAARANRFTEGGSASHLNVSTSRTSRITKEASTSHVNLGTARANSFTEGASTSHEDVSVARSNSFMPTVSVEIEYNHGLDMDRKRLGEDDDYIPQKRALLPAPDDVDAEYKKKLAQQAQERERIRSAKAKRRLELVKKSAEQQRKKSLNNQQYNAASAHTEHQHNAEQNRKSEPESHHRQQNFQQLNVSLQDQPSDSYQQNTQLSAHQQNKQHTQTHQHSIQQPNIQQNVEHTNNYQRNIPSQNTHWQNAPRLNVNQQMAPANIRSQKPGLPKTHPNTQRQQQFQQPHTQQESPQDAPHPNAPVPVNINQHQWNSQQPNANRQNPPQQTFEQINQQQLISSQLNTHQQPFEQSTTYQQNMQHSEQLQPSNHPPNAQQPNFQRQSQQQPVIRQQNMQHPGQQQQLAQPSKYQPNAQQPNLQWQSFQQPPTQQNRQHPGQQQISQANLPQQSLQQSATQQPPARQPVINQRNTQRPNFQPHRNRQQTSSELNLNAPQNVSALKPLPVDNVAFSRHPPILQPPTSMNSESFSQVPYHSSQPTQINNEQRMQQFPNNVSGDMQNHSTASHNIQRSDMEQNVFPHASQGHQVDGMMYQSGQSQLQQGMPTMNKTSNQQGMPTAHNSEYTARSQIVKVFQNPPAPSVQPNPAQQVAMQSQSYSQPLMPSNIQQAKQQPFISSELQNQQVLPTFNVHSQQYSQSQEAFQAESSTHDQLQPEDEHQTTEGETQSCDQRYNPMQHQQAAPLSHQSQTEQPSNRRRSWQGAGDGNFHQQSDDVGSGKMTTKAQYRVHPLDMLSREADMASNRMKHNIAAGRNVSNYVDDTVVDENVITKETVAMAALVNPRHLKKVQDPESISPDRTPPPSITVVQSSSLSERFRRHNAGNQQSHPTQSGVKSMESNRSANSPINSNHLQKVVKQTFTKEMALRRAVQSAASNQARLFQGSPQRIMPKQGTIQRTIRQSIPSTADVSNQVAQPRVVTTRVHRGERTCCKILNLGRDVPVSVIRQLGEEIAVVNKVGRLKKNPDIVVITFAEDSHTVAFRRRFHNAEVMGSRIQVEFVTPKNSSNPQN